MAIHLPYWLLDDSHCGRMVLRLRHQCPLMASGYTWQQQGCRQSQFLAHLQTYHNWLCPQLCHTRRRFRRRTLPHYGAFPRHQQARGHLQRHSLCHDAHLCPLLALVHQHLPMVGTCCVWRPRCEAYPPIWHPSWHFLRFLPHSLLSVFTWLQKRLGH